MQVSSLGDARSLVSEAINEFRVAPPPSRVAIYGAGFLGRQCAVWARRMGVIPTCFIDSNPALWGTSVDSIPIVPFDNQEEVIVVAVHHWSPAVEQLMAMGARELIVYPEFMLASPDDSLPFRCLVHPSSWASFVSDPRLASIESMMLDDASRIEFARQVVTRCFVGVLDSRATVRPRDEEWFDVRVPLPAHGLTYVDGGAYDGDTIQRYVNLKPAGTWSAIGIEPDASSFSKLITLGGRYTDSDLHFINAVFGSRPGLALLSADGSMATSVSMGSGVPVPIITIDGLAEHYQIGRVKLDVEGSEVEALLGSTRTIARGRTTWAIAAYHREDDITSIPRFFAGSYVALIESYAPRPWDSSFYFIPTP